MDPDATLREEAQKAFKELENLHAELEKVGEEMADPAVYEDEKKLEDALKRYAALEEKGQRRRRLRGRPPRRGHAPRPGPRRHLLRREVRRPLRRAARPARAREAAALLAGRAAARRAHQPPRHRRPQVARRLLGQLPREPCCSSATTAGCSTAWSPRSSSSRTATMVEYPGNYAEVPRAAGPADRGHASRLGQAADQDQEREGLHRQIQGRPAGQAGPRPRAAPQPLHQGGDDRAAAGAVVDEAAIRAAQAQRRPGARRRGRREGLRGQPALRGRLAHAQAGREGRRDRPQRRRQVHAGPLPARPGSHRRRQRSAAAAR